MISWFARNSVAANLLMFVILIAGFYTMWQRVTIETFPSTEFDYINVSVPFRGATPEEVEQTVSTRIEEAIYDLEGIKQLSSSSSEHGVGDLLSGPSSLVATSPCSLSNLTLAQNC